VVSSKGATIQGEAMDGSAPATDFSVVLFSSNPDHWFRSSRFLKTTRGSSAGKFRLDGVADGDYFVGAVDPLDGSADSAWQDRDFLQWLTISARRVRVREGDDRNLTLAVTHR
jgi:transcriptional regulator GlxA family with amidase domain